jgi:hypothetical protein
MPHPIQYDQGRNVAVLGGQSLVFHCHYYNCALQKAIEDGLGPAAREVLRDAAAEPVRQQIAALCGDACERAPAIAAELFAQLGFGMLDLSGVTAAGGQATVRASHYAMGWVAAQGDRHEPVCRFVEGFIAGAVAAAFDRPVAAVGVVESLCYACGEQDCRFDVEVA